MLKRHAAFLIAVLLVLGASAAFAATTGGVTVPTWEELAEVDNRLDGLEVRVSELEG